MDPKLPDLTTDGNFRAKVEAVLGHMMAKGCKSKIAESIRTKTQQAEKVRMGYSKTMKSNHLPGKDGKARAADVVDVDLGWNASKRYWLLLGACCKAHSVGWGGLFGLNKAQKLNVGKCIEQARKEGWPLKSSAYQCSLGWDPAHLEVPNNWPN